MVGFAHHFGPCTLVRTWGTRRDQTGLLYTPFAGAASARMICLGRPVAVIGAGLVGAGWAIVFAQAGLDVRVYDVGPAGYRPGNRSDRGATERVRVLRPDRRSGCDRRAPQAGYRLAEAVEGAAYAQESALERVDLKRRLMQDLEQVGPPDLVIGSSSSGIPASAFTHGLELPREC